MTASIALCADSESLVRPELIGLSGERLEAQPWLSVFSEGARARAGVAGNCSCEEAWVVSSDDVEPINLAAALKRDAPRRRVFLVTSNGSGSLRSRVNAAGIDGVFDRVQFAERYRRLKERSLPTTGGNVLRAGGSRDRDIARADGGEGQEAAHAAMGVGVDAVQASGQNAPARPARTFVATAGGTEVLPRQRQPAPRPQGGGQAFVLVVASASGGSGKSTMAALSAVFAQGLGHRTLLLDADLQFGDERVLLGAESPRTLDEVAAGAALPAPSEGDLPALLAAPARLEDSERLAAALPEVIDRAGAAFDVVVVNTGPFWGEQHAVLAERASRVLFLVDQRASSLKACKHALELCGRCGIPTTPFLYAVNRCKRGAPLSSIDVSCALKGAAVAELRDGGRAVDELLSSGLPLDLVRDENPLCVSLESLLADVLPESRDDRRSPAHAHAQDEGKGGGALSRLKRRMSCLC